MDYSRTDGRKLPRMFHLSLNELSAIPGGDLGSCPISADLFL
jgi:hypothetical protein